MPTKIRASKRAVRQSTYIDDQENFSNRKQKNFIIKKIQKYIYD